METWRVWKLLGENSAFYKNDKSTKMAQSNTVIATFLTLSVLLIQLDFVVSVKKNSTKMDLNAPYDFKKVDRNPLKNND